MEYDQTTPLVLYAWPAQWGLSSLDPQCLAAIIYMRLALPEGRFQIAECTDSEASPSGQLPFLVHGHKTVSSFSGIIHYVSGLSGRSNSTILETKLSNVERAQSVAWMSSIQLDLGDLVAHSLFSSWTNWTQLTQPAYASMLHVPQCYFIPDRIRESYRPRLEKSGLWNLPVLDADPQKPFSREKTVPADEGDQFKETFRRTFETEKVMEQAHLILQKYEHLIENKTCIFPEKPTVADMVLAAHILLLIEPPYPDPVIKTIILQSYPNLVAHARHIQQLNASLPQTVLAQPLRPNWRNLVSIPKWRRSSSDTGDSESLSYTLARWAWIAGVFVIGTVVWRRQGIKLVLVAKTDEADDEEEVEVEEVVEEVEEEAEVEMEDEEVGEEESEGASE